MINAENLGLWVQSLIIIVPLFSVVGYFLKVAWDVSGAMKATEMSMRQISGMTDANSATILRHEAVLHRHDLEITALRTEHNMRTRCAFDTVEDPNSQ
jgi:hypothetical protein